MNVNTILERVHSPVVKKLSEQLTVRLPEDVANEIDQIAESAGSNPTEILRLCVNYGLPIVRQGFTQMNALLEEKLPKQAVKPRR
jgi:hypothetical protein